MQDGEKCCPICLIAGYVNKCQREKCEAWDDKAKRCTLVLAAARVASGEVNVKAAGWTQE